MTAEVFTARAGGGPVASEVVDEAARWMAILQSGVATPDDHAACERWRCAAPEHERAWQRMQGLGGDLQAFARAADPQLARAALRQAARGRRKQFRLLAGLGLAGLVGWQARKTTLLQPLLADHAAAVGERRELVLDDGSRLLLDTRTAVDVAFTADLRLITLRTGAIQLTTGRDSARRALRVRTASGSIEPVGTRFTVRYEPDTAPGVTVVAVLEGAVDVRPARVAGPAHRLAAGRRLSFSADGVEADGPASARDSGWTDGMLVVERMRLDDFLSELGRYRHGRLGCDPTVAALPVSGAYALRDPNAVLALLQTVLPIRVRTIAGFWTTVGPR